MKKFDFSSAAGLLLLGCAVTLAVISGCAGFTEDGNAAYGDIDDSVSRYAEAFNLADEYQTGSVQVDASLDEVTVILDKRDDSVEADSMTYSYEFSGDTLLLSYEEKENGKRVRYTRIFVGDSTMRLNGIWKQSECILKNDKRICEENADEVYWKFDDDEVEIRVVANEKTESSGSGKKVSSSSVMSSSGDAGESSSSETKAYPRYSGSDDSKYDSTAHSLTDLRDGKVYRTTKIGDLVWMAENLDYAYNVPTQQLDSSSFCYKNEVESCDKYGRLYLWSAAMDSAAVFSEGGKGCSGYKKCSSGGTVCGACPNGWHLPNNTEWKNLFTAVGGKSDAGAILKSTNGWLADGNGSDDYGFSALPGGAWYNDGKFLDQVAYGNFWSSSENGDDHAYYVFLLYMEDNFNLGDEVKDAAFSVRCVRDSGVLPESGDLSSSSTADRSSASKVTLIHGKLGACFGNGSDFFWKSDYASIGVDTVTYDYEFSGDTLLLTYVKHEDGDDYQFTKFLVGGTSGKLDGSWMVSECYLKKQVDRQREGDDEPKCEEVAYETYWIIDGKNVDVREKQKTTFNFMKTDFIRQLYYTVEYGIAPSFNHIFEAQDVSYEERSKNIEVVSRTDSAETFIYNNHTVRVVLNYAEHRSDSVGVTVSSGGVTCVGTHYAPKMDDYFCDANFADKIILDHNAEDYPPYPENLGYPAYYWDDNGEEFAQCVLKAILKQD